MSFICLKHADPSGLALQGFGLKQSAPGIAGSNLNDDNYVCLLLALWVV